MTTPAPKIGDTFKMTSPLPAPEIGKTMTLSLERDPSEYPKVEAVLDLWAEVIGVTVGQWNGTCSVEYRIIGRPRYVEKCPTFDELVRQGKAAYKRVPWPEVYE